MTLVKNKPKTKQDLDTIRQLLKQVRNFAQANRYGGWYEKWQQAIAAIEALERIEHELVEKRQMQLL